MPTSPSCSRCKAVYAAWLSKCCPTRFQGTYATADALQAIVDLDLESLAAIEAAHAGYTAATDEF